MTSMRKKFTRPLITPFEEDADSAPHAEASAPITMATQERETSGTMPNQDRVPRLAATLRRSPHAVL